MPQLERPPSLLALHSYLASQVARHGSRQLEAALDRHGLLLGHHAILATLGDLGAVSQREIAQRLRVDKSHLSGRINQLESAGLVTRTLDPQDRRRHRVLLSAAGHTLLDELRSAAQASQRRLLEALTPAEAATLEKLLRRVLDANDRPAAAG
jgi:DNA-binding MarR family transcriptional regulator